MLSPLHGDAFLINPELSWSLLFKQGVLYNVT